VASIFAWIGILGLAGCAGAASGTALTPVTGILVRADALVSGIGCGTGDGQVYKYAAAITQVDQSTHKHVSQHLGGVFDCYADGAFRQLLPGTDATLSFSVQIYAFDRAAYLAQDAQGSLERDASDWDRLQAYYPTYFTTCTATQQQNVEVLAVCPPLSAPPETKIQIDTMSFPTTAGISLECNGAYSTVQASYTTGDTSGDLTPVSCPAPLIVHRPRAPATYLFTLNLLNASMPPRLVAKVHCHAATTPRADAVAVCDPAE
jgi:hypothetical protein